jgi:hypothetical protein
MANFTGISGIEILDADDGKVALSIVEQDVLRTLQSSTDSFIVFNARNGLIPDNIQAGSVYFRLLKIIGTVTYDPSIVNTSQATTSKIRVDVDNEDVVGYELSSYDLQRIQTAGELRSRLSENALSAIRKSLNAHFILKIQEASAGTTPIVDSLGLSYLGNTDVSVATPELIKQDAFKVYAETISMAKAYDSFAMGTEFSEFFGCISLEAMSNLLRSYTNPMNTGTAIDIQVLGRRVVAQKLWGISYLTDDMLQNTIVPGASFNGDFLVDTQTTIGFVSHLEALSFPFRIVETSSRRGDNFNLQFATKFAWGFGILRPDKVLVLKKTQPPIPE